MHELWLVSVPRIYIHKKQYEYNNLSSWTMSNRFVHMITCEISSVFSDDHSLPWYSLPLFVLDLTKWVELYPYFDISLKLLKQKMDVLVSKTLLANCLCLIVSPRLIRVEDWLIHLGLRSLHLSNRLFTSHPTFSFHQRFPIRNGIKLASKFSVPK